MFLSSSARLVDACRRGPGRCRTFPGHRGTGSLVRARRCGLGRPWSATAGRSSPRTSTATRSYGCNRCQWTPTEGVVADRFARPDLVLRAGTGTATGRSALCATVASRHGEPACSPDPGRWQGLAGTSAGTAVRGRPGLRCSGRANHHDPVTPPNLPRGKLGSGAPPGRKFSSGVTSASPPGVPPGGFQPKGDAP